MFTLISRQNISTQIPDSYTHTYTILRCNANCIHLTSDCFTRQENQRHECFLAGISYIEQVMPRHWTAVLTPLSPPKKKYTLFVSGFLLLLVVVVVVFFGGVIVVVALANCHCKCSICIFVYLTKRTFLENLNIVLSFDLFKKKKKKKKDVLF